MTSIHRFEAPVIDLLKGIISLAAKDNEMLKNSTWIKHGNKRPSLNNFKK
jgi:hypothetical protein